MNEPTPVDSALEQQAQWLALEARLTDEELNDQHRDGLRRRLADIERQWAELCRAGADGAGGGEIVRGGVSGKKQDLTSLFPSLQAGSVTCSDARKDTALLQPH